MGRHHAELRGKPGSPVCRPPYSPPPPRRIFVALEPCGMRKGFEGLQAMASGRMGEEVKSGAHFVFTNKRRTRLKVLYWDGTGLWLMTKGWKRARSHGRAAWSRARESCGSRPRRSRCPSAMSSGPNGSPMGSICGGRSCARGMSAGSERMGDGLLSAFKKS